MKVLLDTFHYRITWWSDSTAWRWGYYSGKGWWSFDIGPLSVVRYRWLR